MKKLSYLLILLLTLSFVACSEDDGGTKPEDETKPWIGTWLSAGTDLAPILVEAFNYDSVRVTIKEDKTLILESHVKDGAWATLSGVYTITESSSGTVHKISINYTVFEQEGIIEVTSGNPDEMKLEAVQTVPDIGATPRTPESGFGSDAILGIRNIQKYKRIK